MRSAITPFVACWNSDPVNLADLIARKPVTPWQQEGKIPWHEPGFSARMLREHLSQEHDRASRPTPTIDAHVAWIHDEVLGGKAGRVLDLGCGPGFYTARLAKRGHACVGIDFSPASIEYARATAERDSLDCDYRLEDLRAAEFGMGYDAALLIFGEFNTFSPDDAAGIVSAARRALAPGGALVLEVHAEEFLRSIGERPPTWFTAGQGVLSDEPHLCLWECEWDDELHTAVERFYVMSGAPIQMESYVSTNQAYSDEEYTDLLQQAGFESVTRYDSLAGDGPRYVHPALFVLVARACRPRASRRDG